MANFALIDTAQKIMLGVYNYDNPEDFDVEGQALMRPDDPNANNWPNWYYDADTDKVIERVLVFPPA